MPLLPPVHPSLSFSRAFSSTVCNLAKSTKQRLRHEHSAVPPYPYGPSQFYKQSNFGLYGLQKIRYGNIVSEKNEIKTRRYWRPNVSRRKLWSVSLNKFIRLRITARVMRTVDKAGGLDEYLLGEKAQRIKELGMGGWKLRWRIMQTDAIQERFRLQRKQLGVPEPVKEMHIGSDGREITKEQVLAEVRSYDEAMEKQPEVYLVDEEGQLEEESFMHEEPANGNIVKRVVL